METSDDWFFIQSSNIRCLKYDLSNEIMHVRFNSGAEYRYFGVPQNIFEDVLSGHHACTTKGINPHGVWYHGKQPSIGSSFDYYIKKRKYRYERLR